MARYPSSRSAPSRSGARLALVASLAGTMAAGLASGIAPGPAAAATFEPPSGEALPAPEPQAPAPPDQPDGVRTGRASDLTDLGTDLGTGSDRSDTAVPVGPDTPTPDREPDLGTGSPGPARGTDAPGAGSAPGAPRHPSDPTSPAGPAGPPAPAGSGGGPAPRTTHVIAPGEHLWSIAAASLGATSGRAAADVPIDEVAAYWVRLCDANRHRIRSGDVNLVFAGEVLELPAP